MYINLDTPLIDIENLFNTIGFLDTKKEQIISIEKPGEGNMNVVLRIKTNLRSFIAKQSRPYVQKYQNIPAPVDRINVEYQFYSSANNKNTANHFPKVLAYNKENSLLFLEDLGACDDMSFLYKTRELNKNQIKTIVTIIADIHSATVDKSYPENIVLRELNYQHIFELPFTENNGFSLNDVQDGLTEIAKPYQTNNALKLKVAEIGKKYLSKGDVLLHGDYYPGSWMQKDNHIYAIDPEFSFLGFAEFDLGVLAAHCIMITTDKNILSQIIELYAHKVNAKLLKEITGIEIMRRLIGLAQLPLNHTLNEKKNLLELSYKLIMD